MKFQKEDGDGGWGGREEMDLGKKKKNRKMGRLKENRREGQLRGVARRKSQYQKLRSSEHLIF
jgi:hypothetical protein